MYSVLIYIKTIELGLAQGINFVYTEEEIKFIDKVFDSVNNKIPMFEEEEKKNRLNLQNYINKQERLNQLKNELSNKNILFSNMSELVDILKECNMNADDILKIVINLIDENNDTYSSKLEYKKI